MDRRTALKNASLILGYSLSVPAVVGILNGCKPEPKPPGWSPAFFNKADQPVVKAFVDIIIPKTDSPAASEVGVVEFLDDMLSGCLGNDAQELFRVGMDRLNELAGTTSFDQLAPEARLNVVKQLQEAAQNQDEKQDPHSDFYKNARGLIIAGYMLSEKIGTEHLAYDPIPGDYEGCIPLEQNGGLNWSLT